MHFACLVCEHVVRDVLAAEAPSFVQLSVRNPMDVCPLPTSGKPSSAASSDAIPTEKNGHTTQQTPKSAQVTRCCVCAGIYHTPCLQEAGDTQMHQDSTFTCRKCRPGTKKQTDTKQDTAYEEELPILVPALAFPYVKRPKKIESDGNLTVESGFSAEKEADDDEVMKETADEGWRVLCTEVEVCMTCRQVEIVAEERESCHKCHNARLHRRCVQLHQAEHGAGVKKKRTYRGTGKKRRRASSNTTLEWCAPCLLEHEKHAQQLIDGSIETRTVAMLLNEKEKQQTDDQVQWWKVCSVCKGRFCMQEFCDPQETDTSLDEILAKALDEENDAEWGCGHCAALALSLAGDALVTVLICDGCNGEFDMAKLDPPLAEAPEGDWFCYACSVNAHSSLTAITQETKPQELTTVIICDGCDGEFEMASIHPPLKRIPEGDWFCNNCVSAANGSTSSSEASRLPNVTAAPLIPVTLLICDLCEGEYDISALDPPLTEVPSGDWFCSTCSTQDVKQSGNSRQYRSKTDIPKRRRPSKLHSVGPIQPIAQEVVVTVLLCDGCDHEFDPLAVHPPVLKIPDGEWFCPACTDARAAVSNIVQTCVGCDSKFQTGGNAVHRPSGTVGGVMLCEACRNLQVGYTRRRSVPTGTVSHEANDVPPSATNKKRNRCDGNNDDQKNSKKTKINLSGPPMVDAATRSPSHQIQSNASVDDNAGLRMLIPKPITMVSSSAGLRNEFDGDKITSGWSFTNPTVVVADPDDNFVANSIDDVEESGISIVCDFCFGEFKMEDILGTSDANAVPARPWFCKPCLRALKRSRKKRPRFSKQMILEMQAYGRLMRATAAKVSDVDAATRLGNPPNSREERCKMYELVGKSVGVFLQWDKQWVMGRIMAFHATNPAMHHTIRFDDGVVASLPLYAFPMVIGTRTMLYVKVPALQNRWWPAQVLQFNALAQNLLLPNRDEVIEARANFRLVRIFAGNDEHVETTQNVSCWVPKYLCRSMKRFAPPCSGDPATTRTSESVEDVFTQSIERAEHEAQAEIERLDLVFQALLAGFRRTITSAGQRVPDKSVKGTKSATGHLDVSERIAQIAEALIGKAIEVTSLGSSDQGLSLGTFIVVRFDKGTQQHAILRRDDQTDAISEALVNLLQGTDGIVYHLEDAGGFSELAVMLELSGSDVGGGIPGEFHSKELLEKAIIRETSVLRGSTALVTADSKIGGQKDADSACSYCLLGPGEYMNGVASIDVPGTGEHEEMVVCAKCDRRFHATCCDPPHAPISLMNPEDGQVLVSDLKVPYVCSDCTSCAGCHRQKDDEETAIDQPGKTSSIELVSQAVEDTNLRWSQWRLPLQAASLCAQCIPYYKANRFCGVCNLVLDDEKLATSVDLLTCSTCHHWIHADCEPDPHPAFHAFSSGSEFTLDVITDASNEQLNPSQGVGTTPVTREADAKSMSSLITPVGSRSPSEEREVLPNGKSPATRDDAAFKTAKQIEEDFARSLRFGTTYDPKMLNNYECLTCRKVRMLHVLHRLGVEDKLDLFKEPVTEAIAPTYFDIIKLPIDLSTMRHKIIDGKYTQVNFRAFRDDFELMCLNAVTFNSKERDFLIWREAWRFYGQGQRIFRQTAPKARMKQRGGRYYDALVIAAKRQLPNNSALAGKPDPSEVRQNGGDGGDNDDDDELDDDENGDVGSDAESEAPSRGAAHDTGTPIALAGALASEGASANNSDTNSDLPASTGQNLRDGPTRDAMTTTPVNGTTLAVTTTLSDHRIAANDTIMYQTKLRSANSSSRIPFFQIEQTRMSAHSYSWLDMCAVCGSAGLQSDFIFCVDCGEGFHSFCIPSLSADRLEGNEQLRAYWRCSNCKMCEICGQPGAICGAATIPNRVSTTAGNVDSPAIAQMTEVETDMSGGQLLLCAYCDRSYHRSCLVPAIKLPSKKRDGTSSPPVIYCASCVTCTNCKSTNGKNAESLHTDEAQKDHIATLERTYSYEKDKCLHCHTQNERETQELRERTRLLTEVWSAAARKNKKDAEKCPLCRRKWDADLEELMQCDACERWVHPPCDELLKAEPIRYRILVNDPNAVYVCAACRPQKRGHVAGILPDGEGWRCQVLIAEIQRKRSQCESSWKETHLQLKQVERWKRLADHTPVYLYILRLGEECLRNFSYRSLNFQGDWYRFTKQQELDATGVVLPEWLLRKANRYMRFKRYMRGPWAAARRRERKTQSFYSKQAVGLNTRKDASAICTIVSEAASCAALLACVHLLYGWRPLTEVVLHLLSSDEEGLTGTENRKLEEPLLKRLRIDENVGSEESKPRLKLEEEIAAIKEQYNRRVAKRHLVREPGSDLTVFGVGNAEEETTIGSVAHPTPEIELSDALDPKASEQEKLKIDEGSEVKSALSVRTSSSLPSLQLSSRANHRALVHLTTASPLHGWPTKKGEGVEEEGGTSEGDDNASSEMAATTIFEDTRFCALCFMIGDNTACGRLLYTESETWVHVNCALWSMEVFEDAAGVLHKCSKAKHRSRLIRCDGCGLMGATVGCAIVRCTTHYHFPCAVDAGVAFLPNGETCCPYAPHLEIVARRLQTTNGIPLTIPPPEEVDFKAEKPQPFLEAGSVNAVPPAGDGDPSSTVVGDNEPASSTEGNKSKGMNSPGDTAEPGSKTPVSDDTTECSVPPATPESAYTVGVEEESSVGENIEDITLDSPLKQEPQDSPPKQEHEASVNNPQQHATLIKELIESAPNQPESVLPVINPRPEPRRSLFSDPPLVTASDQKKKKRAELKRGIKPQAMCYRVGALTVHCFGHVFVGNGSFNTRTAIYPLSFRSTRIFWSTRRLATRCLYECVISSSEIEERRVRQQKRLGSVEGDGNETDDGEFDQQQRRPGVIFKITASDDQERPIVASTPEDALIELRSRVVSLYEEQRGFSATPRVGRQNQGNATVETERNPFLKRSSWFSFALSGDYFFGFGLPEITRHIEELPYAATTAVSRRAIVRKLRQQQQRQGQSPLAGSAAATWGSGSRKRSHDDMDQNAAAALAFIADEEEEELYEFTQKLPSAEDFQTAERVMEQLVRAEQRARQSSGSARTDGFEGNRLFGAPKKTKIMPRRQALNKEATNEPVAGAANGNGNGGSGNNNTGGVAMDIEHLPITMQYRELRRRPFDERMLVRKSSIHGYGLFLKEAVSEGQMIVEYQGQMIGQTVADERERRYEEQGVGSCYMFRLDEKTIIDATRCGNLARFINHSCDPKAFARIVAVEGGEKKIVIFAKRAIAVGDEVTYDYKFPIEDEAIRCDCNAPNCIGRMN